MNTQYAVKVPASTLTLLDKFQSVISFLEEETVLVPECI